MHSPNRAFPMSEMVGRLEVLTSLSSAPSCRVSATMYWGGLKACATPAIEIARHAGTTLQAACTSSPCPWHEVYHACDGQNSKLRCKCGSGGLAQDVCCLQRLLRVVIEVHKWLMSIRGITLPGSR